MTLFDSAIQNIERGRQGLNVGLPMGLPKLVEFVPNIQQGTYYLVGGETGSGKTSFVDECFLYNPFDFIKANPDSPIKVKWEYFSFEIEKTIKITKGICRELFKRYGIVTDVNYVLSRGNHRISDEVYEKVLSIRDYFDELEGLITLHDVPDNPTGVHKRLWKLAEENGHFEYETIRVKNDAGVYHDQTIAKSYVPNNPNLYLIIIIDHISLLKKERGYMTKENIDKMSEYLIFFRNKCNMIPVVVQQLNRNLSSSERFAQSRVLPQLSDFKDSGNSQQDSNIIMSLFSPKRYNLSEFAGYDITKLKDNFRGLSLLKTRDGASDKVMGLHYVGQNGIFTELPLPEQMSDDLYRRLGNVNTTTHN